MAPTHKVLHLHYQGCQILFGTTYQNEGKVYQMTILNTKWPHYIPIGLKIDQMSIK
jgi:hypothetical protein